MFNTNFMSGAQKKVDDVMAKVQDMAQKIIPGIAPGGFIHDLDKVLHELRTLLIDKNSAYGDSALNPIRIFSKAQAHSQILVRIDDKLSRIRNFQGQEVGPSGDAAVEDTIQDLMGYLVLLKISQLRRTSN